MTIRCGVIGVGYLGRFHAQKYKQLSQATFVGVSDVNPAASQTVASELGVKSYPDFRTLLPHVDAVSIAATTTAHYEIAKACLQAGVHVLIEKPITETVVQANTLIALAHQKGLKLQVGHLERFNAARLALEPFLHQPLFIESTRLAPFNPRGTDVNVILDLMIHDIDLIQTMVKSPIIHMDAQGTSILSSSIDIANARLHFQNHCVANVTASRISFKTERKTRVFQRNSYLSIDYHQKQFAVFSKGEGEMFPGIPNILRHESALEQKDALLEEIKAFLACIKNNTPPLVTGEEGRDALGTAQMISDLIHHHQQTVQQSYDEC
ncbi:MAG: Gfo/Idh/MocA family oxidoreductase [Gammaproteobacteria bacterium]|nr:Gfo/Idh/MocA family oxidoreductase [Gammaproteobacteria bacterium]